MIARRARFPIAVTIGVWPCIPICACMRAVLGTLFYVIILIAPTLTVKDGVVDDGFFLTQSCGSRLSDVWPESAVRPESSISSLTLRKESLPESPSRTSSFFIQRLHFERRTGCGLPRLTICQRPATAVQPILPSHKAL